MAILTESFAVDLIDTCRQVKCEKCGKITWAVSVGWVNEMRSCSRRFFAFSHHLYRNLTMNLIFFRWQGCGQHVDAVSKDQFCTPTRDRDLMDCIGYARSERRRQVYLSEIMEEWLGDYIVRNRKNA